MLKRFLIALIWVCSAGSLSAAQITVSQSLDKFEMPYEDQAHFEIILTWPGPQSAYFFDKPLRPELENLKVKQFSSTISSANEAAGETTTKKFEFTLVPIGSGQGKIEPVTVSYVTWPDSVPGSLVTEAMAIKIASPVPSKRAGKSGLRFAWYWWVAMGVAVILAAGAAILFVWRKRKPREVVKSPVELFLERLTQVKVESGGDLKRFQTTLYKQLLWYVNARYALDLATQPVAEILRIMEESAMPETEKTTIGGWLLRADREKFSPDAPAPGETIRLEAEVREFFQKLNVRA